MDFLKQFIKKHFSNFSYFYSILKSRLLVVMLLSIAVGVLDSIGLTLFLPLLQLADGSDSSVDLGNLEFITHFLAYFGIQLTITKALFFMVIVFVIKGIVVYRSSIYKQLTQQKLTKEVRMSIVNLFPRFKYNQFVKTDIGKIQNIFLGEISRLSGTFNNYISMIQGLIMVVIYMLFSFVVDWQFALLVCLGGICSNVIFSKVNRLTKQKSKNISRVGNQFAGVLSQYVTNFKYLKASGKIVNYSKKVEQSIDFVQHESLQMGILNAKVNSFREPLLILIVVLVIVTQITFFNSNLSSIMISLLFFYRALTSIVAVQNKYNNTLANQGAIDNIQSFRQEILTHAESVGNMQFQELKSAIELKNVSVAFDGVPVLKDVSLTIPRFTTVAFVGESGSGKTTLVNTITHLLQVDSGAIYIDGENLKNYNQFSYQNQIGYISQEPTIFNDTIYNNVTFWAPKTAENLEQFHSALRKASIDTFVNELKDGEESILGNNGINLSGGQRQRISIARELFKNVQILILDEATSALDSETEKEIQESIDALKGHITILSIAHRLSTIKNADVIYLMDQGNILSHGNFEALLQQSDRFKKMVQLQEI